MPLVWESWARQIVAFLGGCLLFLAIAAPASAGDGPLQTQRQVTVGVPKSFPPYYLLDEDGNPSGFAVDAMNEVAKRAGFKVTYRVAENGAANFKAIQAGDIDIIPSLGINDYRKQYVAFTQPVDTFRIVLFTRDDTQDITGIDDMAGRPVAVVVDNVGYRFLKKKRPDILIKVFPKFSDALFALLSAKVDAFAYPEPVAWKLAREAEVSEHIKIAAKPLFETKRAMAVRKDRVELLAVLDQAVGEFIASLEYQQVYVKWFGKPDPFWTVSRVAWTMGAAMGVFFLFMVWWRYRAGVRMIQALKESEERFRSVIENSPSGISLKGTDGRFQLVNQKQIEIFGLEFQNAVGKTSFDLFPKRIADEAFAQEQKVMETKSTVTEERKNPTKQGIRDFLITKFPVFDELGSIKGIGTIATDITERKKAEEVAGRLMEAIEGLSENFALYGPDEKMVMCNRNYRMLNEAITEATRPGVSYEEHMRAIVDKGLAPKAVGREEDYIRERMERYRNPTGPYEVVRQDGVWLIHEQHAGGGSMAIIATDITQLKQTEEAALEAQARLAGILDIAPEAVIAIGEDMNIRLFNKGAERIFGYKADEVLLGSLDMLMPDYLRDGHRKHVEGFDGSGDTYRLMDQRQEIMGLRKDGTEFPASASVSKLEIGGEKIYTVMMQDITERRRTHEAMLDAKREAETANRAKSDFLATMSHDLRTPLNAILGFADILSNQYFGPINDKYQEYAYDIQSSGQHLLTLVNEILDLSTVEAGKQSLVKEKLSTMEYIRECQRIVEDKARSRGIDLLAKIPKNLPPLYADRRASRQILLNLLSNAIKFTPEGGKITVSAKASKKNTILKVADTGMGIPAEILPKLTDPFTRAHTDPYLAEQGWGLGLSITKSLIDLHDGTMDIKSKVGKGTTITVTFPNGAP